MRGRVTSARREVDRQVPALQIGGAAEDRAEVIRSRILGQKPVGVHARRQREVLASVNADQSDRIGGDLLLPLGEVRPLHVSALVDLRVTQQRVQACLLDRDVYRFQRADHRFVERVVMGHGDLRLREIGMHEGGRSTARVLRPRAQQVVGAPCPGAGCRYRPRGRPF